MYAKTKLKNSERVLVCAKGMNFASFRIPTNPGRCIEVSGGCILVVGGSWSVVGQGYGWWRWAYIITVLRFFNHSPAIQLEYLNIHESRA